MTSLQKIASQLRETITFLITQINLHWKFRVNNPRFQQWEIKCHYIDD